MPEKINLDHISIILNKPRFPENIGAAARAIRNMGLGRLVVVAPSCYDPDKVKRVATHGALSVVEKIKICETLREALYPYNFVVGTTARLGGERQVVYSPSMIAQKLIAVSQENKIAVVFGPEDRGLTNEEIRLCHELVNIPSAEFSSLNLAQAVMILCYEILMAAREEKREFIPRLANRYELDGMYDQLKKTLIRIDYIKTDNAAYWMNNIRRFLSRIGLRAKEVCIIRGLCRQISWYGNKCYQDGLKAKKDGTCD
ncbi:MAG: RNA methyltransferase [Deltaproteobacteria bacterium]|nr:RNA methyltransferase [Deltaproteobacteria bacterium]